MTGIARVKAMTPNTVVSNTADALFSMLTALRRGELLDA